MWESSPKPNRATTTTTQSPTDLDKFPGVHPTTPPDGGLENSALTAALSSTVKFEKRVWPPVPNTETEKPMVPVKPTVKPPAPTTKPPPPKEPMVKPPPKPAMAVKPNVCNIYAAPTAVTARTATTSNSSKPPICNLRLYRKFCLLKSYLTLFKHPGQEE